MTRLVAEAGSTTNGCSGGDTGAAAALVMAAAHIASAADQGPGAWTFIDSHGLICIHYERM
jgi:hypothetical protein